ncbi:MAG: hypothetical protein QGH94_16280, partial [Phycisphaerae bacterium]|nr:hypothetical protein [Phycisphaerae bacterium]
MRRWCAILVFGLLCSMVVPCAAKAPSKGQTKAKRKSKAKKVRKAKPKPKVTKSASIRTSTPESLRAAIEDLTKTFGAKYPKGAEYLKRLDTLKAGDKAALEALAAEALLANPLLDFDKLIVRRTTNLGLPSNWQSNSSVRGGKYDNEI